MPRGLKENNPGIAAGTAAGGEEPVTPVANRIGLTGLGHLDASECGAV